MAKHYVVLLDREKIPGELRIPNFDHVWVEHPHTDSGEVAAHLWRATLGVTGAVPISRADLDECLKLMALVVTGDSLDGIDQTACAERGIRILHLAPDGRDQQTRADALIDLLEQLVGG